MGRSDGAQQSDVAEHLSTAFAQEAGPADAALGWIVLVCVGLMVLGIVGMLARSLSAAGRRRLLEEGPRGRAGRWLVFMSFVLVVIGGASFVVERKEPDAAGTDLLAASGLVAVGVLLFVAGAWAIAGARRRAPVYRYGVPGEALVRGLRRTRTSMNRQSVFEFDLEVSGPTFGAVSVRHRDTIPIWVGGRVEQGTTVPVKVDPSSPTRLVLDWERFDRQVAESLPERRVR